MKLLSGLSLLLLAAITHAAPRSPSYVQVYQTEKVEEEPRPIAVDFWPQDDVFGFDEEHHVDEYDHGDEYDSYPDVMYEASPFQGSIDLDFNVNEDNLPVLVNDTVSNIIFKDLEQRIAEDVRRMREDFLFFQRLFGRRHSIGRRPSWFMPWGTPDDTPAPVPDNDPTTYDYNPLIPSRDDDDDSLFGGFPFLGGDRPLFPGLPDISGFGFANPDDLPDNYSNQTHEVHSVNGSQVVVNNTINKESGDNFNSFFHHQVIHFKPEEKADVPEGSVEPVTDVPVTEVPQEEEDSNTDEINTVLPTVENEIGSEGFSPETIPEVNPEISSDTQPESDEEEFESRDLLSQQGGGRLAVRSLRGFDPIVFPADDPKASDVDFPGPKSAAYVSNSLSEWEAEEFERDDSERRAPDLSSDTRVNRIHANMQGMTLVDPDAEIFNYGLVLKEAQPQDGDM